MNDFAGMEELLSDFLQEAGEMLSDVDSKLMDLEKYPNNSNLLNEIFRGFHTIKGGAGFLNAGELVALCHLTENLFDKLRNRELSLSAELMDVIFAATSEVRRMFGALQQSLQPGAAPAQMLEDLRAALAGKTGLKAGLRTEGKGLSSQSSNPGPAFAQSSNPPDGVDWDALYSALTGTDIVAQVGATRDPEKIAEAIAEEESTKKVFGRRASDVPGATVGRRDGDVPAKEARESTIRVDTDRLDQVLNLSRENGLAKNRLPHLGPAILQGRTMWMSCAIWINRSRNWICWW